MKLWKEHQAKQAFEKGQKLYWNSQLQEAMPLLENAADLARAIENNQIAADALEMLGNILRNTGSNDKAVLCFRDALQNRKMLKDQAGTARVQALLDLSPKAAPATTQMAPAVDTNMTTNSEYHTWSLRVAQELEDEHPNAGLTVHPISDIFEFNKFVRKTRYKIDHEAIKDVLKEQEGNKERAELIVANWIWEINGSKPDEPYNNRHNISLAADFINRTLGGETLQYARPELGRERESFERTGIILGFDNSKREFTHFVLNQNFIGLRDIQSFSLPSGEASGVLSLSRDANIEIILTIEEDQVDRISSETQIRIPIDKVISQKAAGLLAVLPMIKIGSLPKVIQPQLKKLIDQSQGITEADIIYFANDTGCRNFDLDIHQVVTSYQSKMLKPAVETINLGKIVMESGNKVFGTVHNHSNTAFNPHLPSPADIMMDLNSGMLFKNFGIAGKAVSILSVIVVIDGKDNIERITYYNRSGMGIEESNHLWELASQANHFLKHNDSSPQCEPSLMQFYEEVGKRASDKMPNYLNAGP